MSRSTLAIIITAILGLFAGVGVVAYLASQEQQPETSVRQPQRTQDKRPQGRIDGEGAGENEGTVIPGGNAMYQAEFVAPKDEDYYLAMVNTDATSSRWEYVTSLVATAEAGEEYDQGAFCRVFTRPDGTGYDYTFGGSFGSYVNNYDGIVRRILGKDFTLGDIAAFEANGGGDIGIDTDGEYYYTLTGHPRGWSLRKYDLDLQLVDETSITLPEGHANNDQMLRYVNGLLIAGDLYDPNYRATEKPDPNNATSYSRLWIYTTDLEYVKDVTLEDTTSINGQTVVYYDGTYAVVTADQFVNSTLIAMLYDESWNFIRTIELQDNAQWSMGGQYRDGLIYIAYHKGPHEAGDTYVDIYDTDWNLQETIEVTAIEEGKTISAHAPWITFDDNRMLIAYTINEEAMVDNDTLGRTLNCMLTVYEEK